MSTKIASLYAELGVQDTLNPALQKARGNFDAVKGPAEGLSGSLLGLGKAMLGPVAAGITLVGAFNLIKNEITKDIEVAAADETALTALGATIASTGRTSETSLAQVEQYTQGLSKLFDSTQDEQATNALMRFMDIPTQQIPGDLKVIQDMAAGLGETLPEAAQAFGMAMETGRVRGMGFSRELTTQIAQLMTAGKVQEADAIILDQLTMKYSGQAAAASDTYAGKQARIATALHQIAVGIGNEVKPAVEGLADAELRALDIVTGNVEGQVAQLSKQRAEIVAYKMSLDPLSDAAKIAQNDIDTLNARIHVLSLTVPGAVVVTNEFTDAWNNLPSDVQFHHTMGMAAVDLNQIILSFDDASALVKTFEGNTSNLSDAEQKLTDAEKNLIDVRKANKWDTKGIADATAKVGDARQAIADLQKADYLQTQQWIVDQMEQGIISENKKNGIIGLTQADTDFLTQYKINTGLETTEDAKRVQGLQDIVNMELQLKDKTVHIDINYTSSGGAQPGGGTGPYVPTVHHIPAHWDYSAHPPHEVSAHDETYAHGGQFVIPPGYNENYPIGAGGASSGETVTVTPAGKASPPPITININGWSGDVHSLTDEVVKKVLEITQ